jgi:nucleotide-binding universal stress UspA family protein
MRALNMFSKILVAISASSADTVLASAIETARKYDAQIVVLHVVDPTPSYLGAADDNFGLIVEAMSAHGRKIVAHVRNVLDDQAPEAEVRMVMLPMCGMTVGRAIADVAEETGADLILLGERSTSRWRWLSEDVASEVVRRSGRPVQIAANAIALSSARHAGARWADVFTARRRPAKTRVRASV